MQNTEYRAYLIEIDDDLVITDRVNDLSDSQFIELAEAKGDIYTLEGFATALNLEEINMNNYYIRFIEADINK